MGKSVVSSTKRIIRGQRLVRVGDRSIINMMIAFSVKLIIIISMKETVAN